MTRSRALALLGLVLCTSACGKPAVDSCGYKVIGGQRLVVKHLPMTIRPDESVPQNMVPAIERAVAKINSAAGRTLLELVVTPSGRTGLDGTSSICLGCNSLDPNEHAVTRTYFIPIHIMESDIYLNPDRTYAVEDSVGTDDVHLESLMLHELMHALGLQHTENSVSIMYPILRRGEKKDRLISEDVARLRCGYNQKE